MNLDAAIGQQVEVVSSRHLTGSRRLNVSGRFHHFYCPGSRLGHQELIKRNSWSPEKHISQRSQWNNWTFISAVFHHLVSNFLLCINSVLLHYLSLVWVSLVGTTVQDALTFTGGNITSIFNVRHKKPAEVPRRACGDVTVSPLDIDLTRRDNDASVYCRALRAFECECRRGKEREVKAVWQGAY